MDISEKCITFLFGHTHNTISEPIWYCSRFLCIGLQFEQRFTAAVHRERHGVMHVRDAPTPAFSAETGRRAKSQIDLLTIDFSSGHVLQTVGVGHVRSPAQ
jgi:hypothetical protein